jgi:hypothetical protein
MARRRQRLQDSSSDWVPHTTHTWHELRRGEHAVQLLLTLAQELLGRDGALQLELIN